MEEQAKKPDTLYVEESRQFRRVYADAAAVGLHRGMFRTLFYYEVVGDVEGEDGLRPAAIRTPEAEIVMSPDLFFKLRKAMDEQARKFIDQMKARVPNFEMPEHWS